MEEVLQPVLENEGITEMWFCSKFHCNIMIVIESKVLTNPVTMSRILEIRDIWSKRLNRNVAESPKILSWIIQFIEFFSSYISHMELK